MKSTEIKCKPNIEKLSSYMQSCVEENVENKHRWFPNSIQTEQPSNGRKKKTEFSTVYFGVYCISKK